MQLHGADIRGVPVDEQGIRLDALEEAIQLYRPRLLYTVPTFHNPTGVSMTAQRRNGLLSVAERHGLLIVEDDIYGPLSYEAKAPPPLKAGDAGGVVIYLTSFSKVLMPGLRIGLVVPPPALLDALVAEKRVADLHSPQLTQRALADYLARGQIAAHLRGVRALYRERRDAMIAALKRYFPPSACWTVPAGGLCLWVELPTGVHSTDLYLEAIERGVAFTPGEAFYADHPSTRHIRLAFARHEPATIARGVETLGALVHEHVARHSRVPAPSVRPLVPVV
jgi:DNA-binding transcriptional MocR family regulator